MTEKNIGVSLAQKAPFGLIAILALSIVLSVFEPISIENLGLACVSGIASSVLLLLYWHGRGGVYFILGLLAPLLAVMYSELPTFVSLGWVISGFFLGFCIVLIVHQIYQKSAQR
ncbi:hypothetical protein ACSLBF_06280 [Pseudoalteromonas sp. T1lg65]|uniref:hypothetical protein n=1 Tax=Pseudoalteromonas sp. T1lg65 TaxID=2077101 RepID=UPI003F7A6A6B